MMSCILNVDKCITALQQQRRLQLATPFAQGTRNVARLMPCNVSTRNIGRHSGAENARNPYATAELHQQHSISFTEEQVDDHFQPITAMWARNAENIGDFAAVLEPHRPAATAMTYRELNETILDFAAGLKAHGLQQGDKVCLFAESSSRWIVADQGILMNGAADAVRGSSSPVDELSYIASHSDSAALVLQDRAALNKLLPSLVQSGQAQQLKFIALLWDDKAHSSRNGSNGSSTREAALQQLSAAGVPVLDYTAVISAGSNLRAVGPFQPAAVGRQTLATMVYTSGTTGHPKAVCLSHGNLAYQVDHLDYFLQVTAGDSTLSLLPPWHIYQRTVAYYLFSRGAREVFSSLKYFRDDLVAHPPDHFVCVPLVLDTLYNKVMQKLKAEAKGIKGVVVSSLLSASNTFVMARRLLAGVDLRYALQPPTAAARLTALVTVALLTPVYALAQKLVFSKIRAALGIRQTVVSGGGSLASHLDLFFEAVGIPVLNGWGLTETSPVLACRRQSANIRGSVGLPTPGTQIRVVDPVSNAPVPDGQQGLVLADGPGVMAGGYLGDAEATRTAFVDGWFDTGDLGWRAPAGVAGSNMAGHIVLTGRAKDTLVLLSGKNIEPQPIEDALVRSAYIKHVMLVGEDKRELGALLFPDEDALAAAGICGAEDNGSSSSSGNQQSTAAGKASSSELEALLYREVCKYNSGRPDYHPEDHIAHIKVIHSALSVEGGTLTRTMKLRRPVVKQVYSKQLEQLMSRLRG